MCSSLEWFYIRRMFLKKKSQNKFYKKGKKDDEKIF